MKLIRKLIFFTMLVISMSSQAYDFDSGQINIPNGFEGPVQKDFGDMATSIVFGKTHEDGKATLLQISIWTPPIEFPEFTKEQEKESLSIYLLQFLSGVEKQRTNFKKGDVEFITISGQQASKVMWEGDAKNESMQGIMYVIFYDSKIYNLHTQDSISYEGQYTQQAEKAFEGISFSQKEN